MKLDEPLVLDVVAAVVIAGIVLVVSPGTGVDAILVVVLLVICGIGALVSRRRRRGRSRGGWRGPRVGRKPTARSREPRPRREPSPLRESSPPREPRPPRRTPR